MNVAQALKTLNKEALKKRVDANVQTSLQVILSKFTEDGFFDEKLRKSIEFDICWKDSFGKYDTHPWNNENLTDKQKLFHLNERVKELKVLCKKLNKFGFKCEAKCHKPSMVNNGFGPRLCIHTPWISVKL